MQYKDGLGHVYNVKPHQQAEFGRRLNILNGIAIVVKCFILAAILAWSWST